MLKNNPYMRSYLNIINESVNVDKYQQIADQIGGVYDVQTNTIDCKGNKVRFKDEWLDQNGTFNFKLINTSNDWSFMFRYCTSLKHLPDGFTIPESVTDCHGMFFSCISLTDLPDNFIIPQNVTDCHCMFLECASLKHLPDGFTIPQGVADCGGMFTRCISLTDLPDSFTIPDGVTDCSWMFFGCRSLTHLPDRFTIPIDCDSGDIFYGCDKLDFQDPKAYQQWEI